MQIVHVIQQLDPRTGGPPAVVLQLAAAQAALGHDLHIVCYEAADATASVQNFIDSIREGHRIHFHRLPMGGRRELFTAAAMLREIQSMLAAPVPTVFHLHGLWEPMLPRIASLLRRKRIPYVIMLHGMLNPYSMAQKTWKKKIFLALGCSRMINGAAWLHTLNADEKRYAEAFSYAAPTEVLPNGIDPTPPDASIQPGHFLNRRPELKGRPYMLFVARLHSIKGLDVLLDAMDIYIRGGGPMDLVLAGPDGGALADVNMRITKYKLEDRVHVVGSIYREEKQAALNDATAFVLTSRQEGFSISISEALAAGLPVIISDQCHFPEVAQAGAGLIVPLDAAATARAMAQISANPAAAKAMGDAGRKLVFERYAWPKIAQRSIELYQKTLAATPVFQK